MLPAATAAPGSYDIDACSVSLTVLTYPFNRCSQSFFECVLRRPAEDRLSLAAVSAEPIDLAVLRPHARAFERDRNVAIHQLENQRGEIADRYLTTRTEIDRLADRLGCFRGFDESFNRIGDKV